MLFMKYLSTKETIYNTEAKKNTYVQTTPTIGKGCCKLSEKETSLEIKYMSPKTFWIFFCLIPGLVLRYLHESSRRGGCHLLVFFYALSLWLFPPFLSRITFTAFRYLEWLSL